MTHHWGFYGRRTELNELTNVLRRKRWFFVKVTGRRRIGKTTLIRQALDAAHASKILYVQIPDSAPAGVLSAVADAFDTFHVDQRRFPLPASLHDLAGTIGDLARSGYVVALDEFQYFNREHLSAFPSFLQKEVDELSRDAERVPGGLLVLGSLHTEIQALLDDRGAPLFSRTTDEIDLGHLDISSVLEIVQTHARQTPERLLFLWSLFEGVPKFYRDCFEQGMLDAERRQLLRRMFFESSSPLRTEADNWFLKELRGRYDVVLKYVARNEGCTSGDITNYARSLSRDSDEQVAGYLKILVERYRIIERKLPIFAKPKTPRGRYYIADNFLASWLGALASPVSALSFSPVDALIEDADRRMMTVEGHAFEKLVRRLYEERSRKGIGDFNLTHRIDGYWNSADTEIDLVAVDDDGRRIRFATCKRAADRLLAGAKDLDRNVARFLDAFPQYRSWVVEKAAVAPKMDDATARELRGRNVIAEDLRSLLRGLL